MLPGSDIPKVGFLDEIYFDKWVHAGLFGTLTFLFSFPLLKNNLIHIRTYLFIAVAALVYGILMEYVQKYFVANRDFDFDDMVADGVGCFLAFLFIRFQLKRRFIAEKK